MDADILLSLVPDGKGGYELIETKREIIADAVKTGNQGFRKDGAIMLSTNTTNAANAASTQLNNDVTVNNKSSKKDSKAMNTHIIGIDHGYKNMKSVNAMFPTKLSKLESRPDETQMDGIVEYKGSFYNIHGRTLPAVNLVDKCSSNDYYILTLAVLGEEFEKRGIQPGANKIHVRIGCGLPQKWHEKQKESFKNMIWKEKEVRFSYNGKNYDVIIENVSVFIQGFSALPVLDCISDKKGHIVLVDIGGETMDVIVSEDFHVLPDDCRIDTNATIALLKTIDSAMKEELGKSIPEMDIISFICSDKHDVKSASMYEKVMIRCATEYSESVFIKLKEWGINTDYSQIVFLGGGAMVIRAFGRYGNNVHFCDDIKINAKGYEFFEEVKARKNR